MDSELIYNIAGSLGAFLILFGFYRTSIGKWENKSFWYELDNLAGALLLVIYQLHHGATISVVVNIIWAIIAFRGLASFAERYNHRTKKSQTRRKRTA